MNWYINCVTCKVLRKWALGGSDQSGRASWGRWPESGRGRLRIWTGRRCLKQWWMARLWAPTQAWEFMHFTRGIKGYHKQLKGGNRIKRMAHRSVQVINWTNVYWARPPPPAFTCTSSFTITAVWGKVLVTFQGGQLKITETTHHRANEGQGQNAALSLSVSHLFPLSMLSHCQRSFMLSKKKLLYCFPVPASQLQLQYQKNTPDSY